MFSLHKDLVLVYGQPPHVRRRARSVKIKTRRNGDGEKRSEETNGDRSIAPSELAILLCLQYRFTYSVKLFGFLLFFRIGD